MTAAELGFAPADIDVPHGHFIGGRLIEDASEVKIPVLRPSDGGVQGEVSNASAQMVDHAVDDAHRAFMTTDWASCAPRQRAAVLRRWADLIDQDRDALSRLEAVVSTRPVSECHGGDVPNSADCLRFFAEYADKVCGDVVPTRLGSLGMVVPQPYGVVGAIAPWNFPLSMASWKCGPALAAGNAIVLKPSEMTPYSAVRMAQLAIKAGMPPGIFNVIQGSGAQVGDALVRHPQIGKVSFTGSTVTGRAVMTAAAQSGPKPVTLELGGKSPQLVFDDAGDLDTVAERITRGFTANGGQACVAGTRLIVQQGIAEALIDAIFQKIKRFAPAPTWDMNAGFSPIISARQAERIDTILAGSVAAGAEVLAGGQCFDTSPGGHFYQPTLLANISSAMDVVRQEVFGPVLTVQTFANEEEGLALAAHPEFGLAAGVHTLDAGRAMRAMRALAAGTVWINRYGRSGDFIIPTGGFNGSGIGKDLGRQALEANLRYKSVLMDFA